MSIFDLFDDRLREAIALGEIPTKIYVDDVTFSDCLEIMKVDLSRYVAKTGRRPGYNNICYMEPSGQVTIVRSKNKFNGHRIVCVNYDLDDWIDREAERILLVGEEDG